MVTFDVTIPAGTSMLTGALDPLVTVRVAGLVSMVATKMLSLSMLIPFGAGRGSPVHTTPFGVGRYQYTISSVSTVGVVAPDL